MTRVDTDTGLDDLEKEIADGKDPSINKILLAIWKAIQGMGMRQDRFEKIQEEQLDLQKKYAESHDEVKDYLKRLTVVEEKREARLSLAKPIIGHIVELITTVVTAVKEVMVGPNGKWIAGAAFGIALVIAGGSITYGQFTVSTMERAIQEMTRELADTGPADPARSEPEPEPGQPRRN